jgi:integrase
MRSGTMSPIRVRDTIGDMPIQKINTDILLDTLGLRELWTKRHAIAQTLHSHLKRIFSFAIASGYYHGDNPAAWVNHLQHVLPPTKDVHSVTHHASLPYKDAGRFMAKLRAYEDKSVRQEGHTAAALLVEFIVLTGVRMSEARLATWEQIDLQTLVWNVAPENLKTGHLNGKVRPVPITPPMLAVLDEMQRRRTNQAPNAWVFPRHTGRPYGDTACSQFICNSLKWEPRITIHGFRSTLTDWCHANGFSQRLIDRQLDHVVGNKVAQSYGHDQMIEERRAMMRGDRDRGEDESQEEERMRMELIDKAELEPLLIARLEPLLAKLLDKTEIARIEPLLCSVAEASVMTGRSKRFIADGIARGLFQAKKSDGRTLLVVQSLKDYVAGLPEAKGTLNRHSRSAPQIKRPLRRPAGRGHLPASPGS